MSSSELEFLRLAEPEFAFMDGVEPGSFSEDFMAAADGNLLLMVERVLAEVDQYQNRGIPVKPATPLPMLGLHRMQHLEPSKFFALMHSPVWQASEGAGKSSVVRDLVNMGKTVVFCSRTNDQLVEQEQGFRARWPELRTRRYVSKARHLQERLAELGIAFELSYYTTRSPYAAAAIDEPSTRQALRKALDNAGYESVDHHVLFEKLYTMYKSPPIIGLETDVVLLTVSAFQAFCASRHRPWWHALGLLAGQQRPVERYGKTKFVEVGLPGIMVLIDDPDRTDFDFRRLVDDEDALELHRARGSLPAYQQPWRTVKHWTDDGYGERLANELAMYHEERAAVHDIETFQEKHFEHRPAAMHIGYNLTRGFNGKDKERPKIKVLTTEHITARLAVKTLVKTQGDQTLKTMFTGRLEKTDRCHVTLLSTRLCRKKNHILLLLIAKQLAIEFPNQDVELIANGLGCDLNLLNNRGRNDLADKSTIIKLSIPNPSMALNLWAQFPASEKPGVLNTILLADLANQALGRNQGNRFRGKPAVLLIDPMYMRTLVASDLLRYACTPWSSHAPPERPLALHHPKSAFEARLMDLLIPANARRLGLGLAGFRIGVTLPDEQRAMYEAWLDNENMVFPWPRVEHK